MGNLMLWLDAEKAEYLSTDGTISPPNDDDGFSVWYDRSGKQHHARAYAGTPLWDSTAFNSKPGVVLDSDVLKADNSESSFDGWEKLHVIAALYQDPGHGYMDVIMGKTTYSGWLDNGKDTAWSVVVHRQDGGNNYWGPQVITDTNGDGTGDSNRYIHNLSKRLQGDDGGAPGLFTMSFDGATLRASENGGALSRSGSLSGVIQPRSNLPFTVGGDGNKARTLNLKIGEIIIYHDKLSDADEDKIEGYLAHKWNLTSTLPSDHTYKSSAPSFGGWAIGRATSGNDAIALNMENAGGEFSTNVPVNDNEWHHLTTTYGSGNKKIYVDGVEVSTASQTGTVAASTFKLILGDPDPHAGASPRPKIDDVRFYRGVLTAAEVLQFTMMDREILGSQNFRLPAATSMVVGHQ